MKIAKINIDESPSTPSKYGVRGIPTLMLFKDGQVAATKIGAPLPEAPIQAETRAELKTLLSGRQSGGIVFTTIHNSQFST